jgi:hypothetical protein
MFKKVLKEPHDSFVWHVYAKPIKHDSSYFFFVHEECCGNPKSIYAVSFEEEMI